MILFRDDTYFMKEALKEAKFAYEKGEIPVGAVIVNNQRIIGRGHNLTEQFTDVTAHAEIIALSAAVAYLGSKYITDCTLYVTLEPCPMCSGALAWAQLSKLVYGASDERRGFKQFTPSLLHPKTVVQSGILEQECKQLMTDFFKSKR